MQISVRQLARKYWVFMTAAAIASALLPGTGWAQSASVTGTVVTRESGAPLFGVRIEAQDGRLRAVTDARGRYYLAGVPSGSSTLRFTRLGYRAVAEQAELAPGERRVIDVRLEMQPLALNPIAVLLERTRMVGDPLTADVIPGSAAFLSRQDMQEQKLLFDDVHDVVRQIPGVYVQDEEGYGLRPNIGMRGTGVERSSKITLMEDGVLAAPAPYAAPSAYYFPTVGRMEAVEVRKGSSQIQYGPYTIGGALNLISTPIPEEPFSWAADLAGGRDATGKLNGRVGGSTENWGWLFETYQLRTDGFKELPNGGNTGFRLQDYVGKVRYRTARDAPVYQELELKLGYSAEVSDETYLGLTDSDFAARPLLRYPASRFDRMDNDHQQIMLRHFVRPGGVFDLTTTIYRNDFARNWYKLQSVTGVGIANVLDDPGENAAALAILKGGESEADALKVRANNREYFARGVQSTLGISGAVGATTHGVELGVRFHQDQEDRFQWEDGFRMTGSEMILTSHGTPGSQSNRVSEAEAVAVYLQDEIGWGKLTLTPGVRWETIDFTRTDYGEQDPDRTSPAKVRENHVSAVIPGIGATYEIRPWMVAFGGVHKGFGPPGPGADAQTDAEESVSVELGARARRHGLALQLAGFASDYSNILGRATLAIGESGAGELFNGGAVDVRGIEAAVEYDPFWGRGFGVRLPLRLAYTFTDAEFRTAFESDYGPWGDVEPGDELPYLPRQQFNASAGVETNRWGVTLAARGSSAMRTLAGQGPISASEATDDYVVLKLTGEYTLPRWGTLYAGVQNLTDEHYIVARRPAGVRPGLPRTLLVGLRVGGG